MHFNVMNCLQFPEGTVHFNQCNELFVVHEGTVHFNAVNSL